MKITLTVAALATLAGGATLGLADRADPTTTDTGTFQGRYSYLSLAGGPGGPFATTWTVTPCGRECVHITTASGLTDTDAHLDGAHWVFDRYDEAGIVCDNQKVLPATVRFRIDPASLRGELQPQGDPCGGASRASAFTLTKLT